MEIPLNEIIVESSGVDGVGKIFRWKNEVYRGIYSPYASFYKTLFSCSLGDDLINLGLIPTEISPYQAQDNDFEIVLKHKTVPVISYATEWSRDMLKDAALLTCDIQLRLLQSGCTLKDAHPWNILFDACTPRFVDVGSISEISPSRLKGFFDDFLSTFLYPLLLRHGNASPIADSTMAVYLGIPKMPFYRMLFMLIPMREWFYHYRMDRKIRKMWQKSPVSCVKILRKQIEAIPGSSENTGLTGYICGNGRIQEVEDQSQKIQAVTELLDLLQPKSVLDVGSNRGLYSELAASKGARVIVIDQDEFSAGCLYHYAKGQKLDILPLHSDFCAPTFAYGTHRLLKSAEERFESELVMMLSLTHQLVQRCCATFHDIAHFLSSFTEKFSIVEFVGPSDKHVASWNRIQSPGYCLNNFIRALGQYFPRVSKYCQTGHDRWLILCTRNENN